MASRQRSSIEDCAPLHHQDQDQCGDSLSVMIEQERTTYACRDYFNCKCVEEPTSPRLVRQGALEKITAEDRSKLVEWCYEIVDKCTFRREYVAVAMNLVDRFMSIGVARRSDSFFPPRGVLQDDIILPHYDRGQYQLLVMSALYISVKLGERSALSSEVLSAVSRGAYSTREIERTELIILQGLKWRLCPPTTLQMGHRILDSMASSLRRRRPGDNSVCAPSITAWDFLRGEVAFQSEIAVLRHCPATLRSSSVAAAAVLNAVERLEDDAEHKIFMHALADVLAKFDFDPPRALLDARDCLRRLVEENESDLDRPPHQATTMASPLIDDEGHRLEGEAYYSRDDADSSSCVAVNYY